MNRLLKKLLDASAAGGSTIVGVLAAMVFITLVTSFMVKNTGAQSAASVGYGTDMVMQSTVRSGVLAAEVALDDSSVVGDVVGKIFTVQQKGRDTSIFLLGKSNKRDSLGPGQYFSGKVRNYNSTTKNLWVEVSSGKNIGGKGLKRALAFYHIDNMGSPPPPPPGGQTYTPKNAIYLAGPFTFANTGLGVIGNATIEGNATFQNVPVSVRGGTAYFGGAKTTFLGETVKFDSTVYFNGDVEMNNVKNGVTSGSVISNVFNDNVGVWGNFTALNKTIKVPDKFYISGVFGSNNPPQITGVTGSSDNKLYYTNNLNTQVDAINNFSKKPTTFESSQVMRDSLAMGNPQSRRETPLDISNIPPNKILTAAKDEGVGKAKVLNDGGNLKVTNIHNAYEKAKTAGLLYNGHLVVEITSPGVKAEMKDSVFKDSVIFIIRDKAKLDAGGSNFYTSDPNSSTMIYVDKGSGYIDQFGSNGLFKGLICIDAGNTSNDNKFSWGINSYFKGAFHNFSTNSFIWNTNGNVSEVPIEFDPAALMAFGSLTGSPGGTTDPSTGSVTNVTAGDVKPIVMGYYFY